ncbi:Leishmanolysin-like peptidase [Acipenser ruthenus]|uniref:Leishmanolysin-like peptidase n=1 Tax=Acipenser ruthenus TaxID=7906 RepID=A0A444UCG1_ACIRT|nr:Leishmanolysin-like peptidase [Acipenser ruthenus]
MLNKTPAGSLLTTIAWCPFMILQETKTKDALFPQAIDYLQKAFQVRKQAGPVLLSRQCATNQYLRKKDDPHRYCQGACAETTRCGPVIVPEQHLQQCKVCSENGKSCGPAGEPDGAGLQDADFVLYVSGLTTERCGQENIVAYAAYCQLEAALDRPIAGYANLCPNMISTQPQEFIGMLSTVKHEIIHALEEARKHFDCPVLEGMELENQGGLGTELNHWEKRLLENEAMTGSHTQNRVFSRITLAIMEDTGWYRANYSMAERLDWGRGMGCDFVMKSCKFWMDKQRHTKQKAAPFCDALRSNPLQLTCRQDHMAVAVCNLQKYMKNIPAEYQYFDGIPGIPFQDLPYYGGSVEIADYCPFNQEFSWHLSGEFQRSSNCRIAENQPDQSRNYGAEQYGPDSVCLLQGSAFVMEQCTRRMAYPDWGSGCYKVLLIELNTPHQIM